MTTLIPVGQMPAVTAAADRTPLPVRPLQAKAAATSSSLPPAAPLAGRDVVLESRTRPAGGQGAVLLQHHMTSEQAAWVRENAWHPWMLSMHNDHVKAGHPGCFLFRMTPCEMGMCESCQLGEHDACGTLDRIENPRPWDPKPEINWNLSVHGDGPYGKAATHLPNCRGWLCPCGCWRRPRPMTDDAAAWVRANALTQTMRKSFAEVPGSYLKCACQYGPTTYCREGQHDRCHRAEPLRSNATWILRRGGTQVANFTEPYAHKTDTSATGPRHETAANVWLADRVCRWLCPCSCGHVGKRVPDQAAGDDGTSRPIEVLQLGLFEELMSP